MKLRRALFRGQGSPFRGKKYSNIGPRQRQKTKRGVTSLKTAGLQGEEPDGRKDETRLAWKIISICFPVPRNILGRPERTFQQKCSKICGKGPSGRRKGAYSKHFTLFALE